MRRLRLVNVHSDRILCLVQNGGKSPLSTLGDALAI
jgi:hypothetical protein